MSKSRLRDNRRLARAIKHDPSRVIPVDFVNQVRDFGDDFFDPDHDVIRDVNPARVKRTWRLRQIEQRRRNDEARRRYYSSRQETSQPPTSVA